MMTAGRFFVGSPERPASSETSHTSPRDGSVDAIGGHAVPVSFLVTHAVTSCVTSLGVPFGVEDLFARGPLGKFGQ